MKDTIKMVIAGMVGGLLVLLGIHFFETKTPPTAKVQAQLTHQRLNTNPRTMAAPFDFQVAAQKAMPAVVHISASQTPQAFNRRPGQQERSPFDLFFGDDFFGYPFQDFPLEGSGSGVIFSEDGYIITNNHVIDFADQVEVTLFDGRTFPATTVGMDPRTDLAVLKIEANDLPTIPFADSDQAAVGEWVLAVGNPFDLTSTVTAGIISAKGRDIDVIKRRDAIEEFIQTDAAVNPGNSGGALVNTEGRLLGINTAIASPTGAFAGYSFAIPANMVKEVVDNIIEFGAPRGMLGVNVMELDVELAEEYQLGIEKGIFIESLVEGGSAQFAGLLPLDVIVAVEGNEVSEIEKLKGIIDSSEVGEPLEVTIYRKGSYLDIPVVLKPAQ